MQAVNFKAELCSQCADQWNYWDTKEIFTGQCICLTSQKMSCFQAWRGGEHLTGRNLEYVTRVKGLEQSQCFLV